MFVTGFEVERLHEKFSNTETWPARGFRGAPAPLTLPAPSKADEIPHDNGEKSKNDDLVENENDETVNKFQIDFENGMPQPVLGLCELARVASFALQSGVVGIA